MYIIRILVAAVVTVIVSKPTTKAVNLSKNLTAENLLKNAQEFLKHVDAQYAETFNKRQIANWNYASNLTEENLIEQLKVEAAALSILDQIIQTVNAFPYSDLEDEYIKKQFEKLSVLIISLNYFHLLIINFPRKICEKE